ncbi:UNVERIFIED_CONTAM: hypothetical protein RMT77_003154 [Armadillidium vulgare]
MARITNELRLEMAPLQIYQKRKKNFRDTINNIVSNGGIFPTEMRASCCSPLKEILGERRFVFGKYVSLYLLVFFVFCPTTAHECDQLIINGEQGPREGIFRAPEIMNPDKHSRQCMYTFIARKGERVQIQFKKFHLRGTPPDGSTLGLTPACNHEYIDIYTEVRNPENINLLETPFGGRYCGRIPPRLRISLFRVVAIVFYTDYNTTASDLFKGHYKFLNGSKYNVGSSGPHDVCGHIVHSD